MITMPRAWQSTRLRALFAPAPTSAAVRQPGQRRLRVTIAVGMAIALASASCGSSHPRSGTGAAASPRITAPPARPATASAPAAAAPPAAPPGAGAWQLLPAAPVTTSLRNLVSVWTGTEMILHGTLTTAGSNSAGVTFAYRPATGTWTTLAPGPVPDNEQTTDLAAWTGTQMLVPGQTDGAYSPATGAWSPIPLDPGPQAEAMAAWTGSQMLIWGGLCCVSESSSGTIYTPATNTWQQLPAAPLEPRRAAMGAWTGTELVVAGGEGGQEGQQPALLSDAAAYNPATSTWRQLPAMPFSRADFAAVWTGSQVLVWGGVTGSSPASPVPPHGEAYDPATNQWTALPQAPLTRSPIGLGYPLMRRLAAHGRISSHLRSHSLPQERSQTQPDLCKRARAQPQSTPLGSQ
jgi:Galactose oxidase, central domain